MRNLAGVILALTLAGCGRSETTTRREVFDCSLTGKMAECLQSRYGWTEQDALIASLKHRVTEDQ